MEIDEVVATRGGTHAFTRARQQPAIKMIGVSGCVLVVLAGCALLASSDLRVEGDEQARGAVVFVDGRLVLKLETSEPSDEDRLWIENSQGGDSTAGPAYLCRKGQPYCDGFADHIASGEHEVTVVLADGRRLTRSVLFREYTELQIRGRDGRLANHTR